MTMTLQQQQANVVAVIPAADMAHVAFTKFSDMLGILADTTGGNVIVVSYETNMLMKGKLKAGAQDHFKKGLWHKVRKTVRIGYSYEKVLETRSEGHETAKGGPTWQQAMVVNKNGKVRITALTLHKEDVEQITADGSVIPAKNADAYLRYEPLTEAQVAAGFAKDDADSYIDNNGNEIPEDEVKPFFFDRKPQLVKHRTLTMRNVLHMKIDGVTHFITED